MVLKQERFPEVGDLVVAQARTIEKMYVYVELEDYKGLNDDNKKATGMIHISELANRWIRNISNYIKINQRVVLKVLRVNPEKGHIDLSLRRVSAEQKSNKLNEWKYEVKALNLFRLFGESKNLSVEDVYEQIGFPLIDEFGDIHTAFEGIKENGISELEFLNLEKKVMEELFNLIDQNIALSQVEIDGTFEIVVYDGRGIEIVKDAFKKVNEIKKDKLVNVNFHYVGAPVYNIKIVAPAYPEAEKHLKLVIDTLTNTIKSYDGSIEFYRS